MGAFDGELYALGFRFESADRPEEVKPELVGPVYTGPCVGYCSSNRCVACSANNRLSDKELESELAAHKESQAHLLRSGLPEEVKLAWNAVQYQQSLLKGAEDTLKDAMDRAIEELEDADD